MKKPDDKKTTSNPKATQAGKAADTTPADTTPTDARSSGAKPADDVLGTNQPLLDSALHFADLRESDFQAAASNFQAPEDLESETRQLLQADPTRELWILLLIATLLSSWAYQARKP